LYSKSTWHSSNRAAALNCARRHETRDVAAIHRAPRGNRFGNAPRATPRAAAPPPPLTASTTLGPSAPAIRDPLERAATRPTPIESPLPARGLRRLAPSPRPPT